MWAGSLFSSLKRSKTLDFCRRSWPIVYWLPTGVILTSEIYQVKIISGRSMQDIRKPTLNPNSSQWRDVALFRKDVEPDAVYRRDDIVTLRSARIYPILQQSPVLTCATNRSPENPKRVLIKRIVATEGDTVRTLPPYPDPEVTIPKAIYG
ncbi:hypothetical protein BDZ97DRAFT_1772297 [Flammula alnicola]|nr:hypothetical protein BDZ97DRAFT_1772297 [Flammula alnicola]